jgi:hypothetical protein
MPESHIARGFQPISAGLTYSFRVVLWPALVGYTSRGSCALKFMAGCAIQHGSLLQGTRLVRLQPRQITHSLEQIFASEASPGRDSFPIDGAADET